MPKHDANLIVFRSVIQQIGQRDIHGQSHCVFLLRPIQLNPQDVFGTLSNNVIHIFRLPLQLIWMLAKLGARLNRLAQIAALLVRKILGTPE